MGEPTVVRSYQVLRAIMHTAVDDELVQRNPCRIKGAGTTRSPERPVLTVDEVFRVSDAIPHRYRALVLLAGFSGLRFGELAALQRSDVDLERHRVQVRRAQVETRAGLLVKAPKSAAGVRTVVFPVSLVAVLGEHLGRYSQPGRSGLVFVGPRGGALRRSNFRDTWTAAVAAAGLDGVHFHDLRYTGNTLAASSGASTRELMQRMGHSSTRAALVYQHLLAGRDEEIAAHVDGLIRRVGDGGPGAASGT
ncbi:tyrosine-type recombinase/integrase [Streptomyces sp. NPDC001380]|uniref:tyrosine-type recombinase/integrase n=1 Tax=Streptomyces sp. NPDC001380 TaxID=3364566 RepID=UPI0036BAA8B0